MEPAALLVILMLATTCCALLAGFPVSFTLAGIALLFSLLGQLFGLEGLIGNLPARIFGSAISNETLIAVPMFVYMGVMLERSQVAENLLRALSGLFGRLPGGLAIAVVLVGAMLAASTGIVGATVVAMGVISLPTMLRSGYAPSLAAGTICAAGTLGQIIPPSIVLVILGDQISAAYQEAQSHLQQKAWAEGNMDFTPQAVSVGDLFAGALLPGLLLVGLFIAYLLARGALTPAPLPPTKAADDGPQDWIAILNALVAPLLLILAVLGSILLGIAPPGEAAAVGAVGATLLAALNTQAMSGNPAPEEPQSTKLGWGIGGFLAGAILGAVLFAGTRQFFFMTGLFACIGALCLPLTSRIAAVRRVAVLLDPGGQMPINCAGLSLIALAGLTLALDLRGNGGNLTSIVTAGAALLCLVSAWGIAIAFRRCHAAGILPYVNRRTVEITAMIFTILIAASLFSLVFRGLGGDDLIAGLLRSLPGDGFWALLAVMLVMFVLGFFLDFVEIALVVVPIVAPILLMTGQIDPIWLGVLMAMNLQTSFLTPPFGFALFYLRGVAPAALQTRDIYRGAVPFIGLQIAAIVLIWIWPGLSTWLPELIFG